MKASEIKTIARIDYIFDSHAHYDDEKFALDGMSVIEAVHENGVSHICNVGTTFESCKTSINLARKFDFVYCSVGIHPVFTTDLPDDWIGTLEAFAHDENVVAIGEVGLDYFCKDENFSRKLQIEAFEKQLDLAEKLSLPVIVHTRKALEDTLSVIKNFPKIFGIIHCFSENLEVAHKFIDMGWKIGFTGVLTFKNSFKATEIVKSVPIKSLVIETDCPYMAPEPWRGLRCNSAMLTSNVAKIAELKNMGLSEVAKLTKENALEVYKIKS